jgi:hypothetical protein
LDNGLSILYLVVGTAESGVLRIHEIDYIAEANIQCSRPYLVLLCQSIMRPVKVATNMISMKAISQGSLALASLIFLVYLIDRISASAAIPIDLYSVSEILMFGLVIIMSALIGLSLIIENKTTN